MSECGPCSLAFVWKMNCSEEEKLRGWEERLKEVFADPCTWIESERKNLFVVFVELSGWVVFVVLCG